MNACKDLGLFLKGIAEGGSIRATSVTCASVLPRFCKDAFPTSTWFMQAMSGVLDLVVVSWLEEMSLPAYAADVELLTLLEALRDSARCLLWPRRLGAAGQHSEMLHVFLLPWLRVLS